MKCIFFQQYEDSAALGIPYNIIDSHNTEHPGFPKKGEYYNGHAHKTMTYYLNNDETKIIVNTGTIFELDAKVINIIDKAVGHISFGQGFMYVDSDIYKVEGTKDIYTFDMIETYSYCKIKTNVIQGLNIDDTVFDEIPIPADAITWYDKPTPEDSGNGLKRIIRKLPLRLDVKNKIIKYLCKTED